jgi:hypothetical protein
MGQDPLRGFDVDKLHDAEWDVVETRIRQHLGGARPGDTRLLYLSTHADRAAPVAGQSERAVYFVAANTRRSELARTGVAVSTVAREIARCRASTVIVIVDTCYAGAIGSAVTDELVSLRHGLAEQLRGPADEVMRTSHDRSSSVILSAVDESARQSLGFRGQTPTFIILASCQATERSPIGAKAKASEFTRLVTEAVSSGRGVDAAVYAAMFRTVHADVSGAETLASQRPQLVILGPGAGDES